MNAKCTGDGILNSGCGADFIQKERQTPHTFDQVPQGSRYGFCLIALLWDPKTLSHCNPSDHLHHEFPPRESARLHLALTKYIC